MKFDCTEIAPSGRQALKLRVGVSEIIIIKALLNKAMAHTPKTPETSKTIQRMRQMARCLNSAIVAQWIEHGDSTSGNAGSNPADGTTGPVAQLEEASDLKPNSAGSNPAGATPCKKCGGDGMEEIQSGPYWRKCSLCGGSGLSIIEKEAGVAVNTDSVDLQYLCAHGHLKVDDAKQIHTHLMREHGVTDHSAIVADWNNRSDEPWDSPLPGNYVSELTKLVCLFMKSKIKEAGNQ